jgi:hypothetical protein
MRFFDSRIQATVWLIVGTVFAVLLGGAFTLLLDTGGGVGTLGLSAVGLAGSWFITLRAIWRKRPGS